MISFEGGVRAYPSPDWNGDWKGPDANHGMALRDYFAIHADYLDLSRHMVGSQGGRTVEEARYAFADAMLAARGH